MAEQIDLVFRPSPTTITTAGAASGGFGLDIDTLTVNATINAAHSMSADVTDHTLDDGSETTDGILKKPSEFRMDGVLSTRNQDGNIGSPEDAFERLAALVGKLMTVRTQFKTYENVVMKTLDIPEAVTDGGVLRFSAGFKAIRYAKSQKVELVTDPRAMKTKNKGDQPTKDADKPIANKSSLAQAADSDVAKQIAEGAKKVLGR